MVPAFVAGQCESERVFPQAGAEPGHTEESPAFGARVEEPLEGGQPPVWTGPGC
jgi:hypothetical protein